MNKIDEHILCYSTITVFKGHLHWPWVLSMNLFLWKTVIKLTTFRQKCGAKAPVYVRLLILMKVTFCEVITESYKIWRRVQRWMALEESINNAQKKSKWFFSHRWYSQPANSKKQIGCTHYCITVTLWISSFVSTWRLECLSPWKLPCRALSD